MEDIKMDKLKRDFYSVETAIKMYERKELRLDHPNQRTPDTWSTDYRDGYASTMIKGEDVDPIKICEEIKDDGKVNQWVIDGGHRVDTLWRFKHNVFKIGNKIDEPVVEYTDYILNENGDVTTEIKQFDLRGKYYKDLPDKLKEDFDGNQVLYVKHLDCNNKKIVYHIKRYNKQKSMNTNENIVASISTEIAEQVKSISKCNRFFKDCTAYSESERKNGSIERCVVESIMSMFHLDNWKKPAGMATYFDNNATQEELDTLNENLNELLNVVPNDANRLFTAKDSFIWFAVYKKFKEMENKLNRFGNFLSEFASNEKLESGLKELENDSSSTKDKVVVDNKINYIVEAMKEYLHIEETEQIDILEFIKENVSEDTTIEDVALYNDILNDLTLNVYNNSQLLNDDNKPSLLAIIAYCCTEDIDLDEWFVLLIRNNNTYINNQKDNYENMKKNLNEYQTRRVVSA